MDQADSVSCAFFTSIYCMIASDYARDGRPIPLAEAFASKSAYWRGTGAEGPEDYKKKKNNFRMWVLLLLFRFALGEKGKGPGLSPTRMGATKK